MRPGSEPKPEESGFVLIATLWLLVLAGAIVALLILRNLSAGTQVTLDRQLLDADLAIDSAIDTALIDRIEKGTQSQWWLLPADGYVDVDGQPVHIRLSNDAGRLDVNAADTTQLDALLREAGADPAARTRFIAAVTAQRVQGGIRSFRQIEAITAATELAGTACLDDLVTFASGRAEPVPEQMPAQLARALGSTAPSQPAPGAPGDPLRIEAAMQGPVQRVTRQLLRITVAGVLVHSRQRSIDCGWPT